MRKYLLEMKAYLAFFLPEPFLVATLVAAPAPPTLVPDPRLRRRDS